MLRLNEMVGSEETSYQKNSFFSKYVLWGFITIALVSFLASMKCTAHKQLDPYLFSRSTAELCTVVADFKVVVRDTTDINIPGLGNDKYVILIGIFPGHTSAGFNLEGFSSRDVRVSGSGNARKLEIWLPNARIVSSVTETPLKWPEIEMTRAVTPAELDEMWTNMEQLAAESLYAKATEFNLAATAESSAVRMLEAWGDFAGYNNVVVHFERN